jgi:hypothetical protein
MAKRSRRIWKSLSRVLVFAVLLLLALSAGQSSSSAQSPTTLALLDRYAAGEFAAVAEALATLDDFKGLLKDLHATICRSG